MGRRPKSETVQTSLRLTPEVHQRLLAAADERMVSASWLADRGLADFLDHLIPADEFMLTRRRGEREQ